MKFEDAKLKAVDYFNGDELAAGVYLNKYAQKDGEGNVLEPTPDEMFPRIAEEFARIEGEYHQNSPLSKEQILEYIKDFKYIIPQGSVLSQLGVDGSFGSLSNCTVVESPFDSYGGIFKTDQELAQLSKRRCGVGVDISTLRPSGTAVMNVAKTSSGLASFMERYSNTINEVAQQGRRGALMLSIDISHPDIEEFALIKQDLTKVTGANISIRISDEFMRAVKNDTDYFHTFPINEDISTFTSRDEMEYDVIEEHQFGSNFDTVLIKRVRASELWEKIVNAAHKSAEPGLIFWDAQHNWSPSSIHPEFKNVSTNPCSEIAMGPNDSCRLLAINLYSFVLNPYSFGSLVNWDKLEEVIKVSMRLGDNLVDLEIEKISDIVSKILSDPEPDEVKAAEINMWKKFLDIGERGRRLGLGFTGLGDMIAALDMRYGSEESIEFVDKLMKFKFRVELETSIQLAIERGSCDIDLNLEEEVSQQEGTMLNMIRTEFSDLWELMQNYGRRHISWSTVAPTGTISMLAQKSILFPKEVTPVGGLTGGVEPMFYPYYKRRRKIMGDESATVDFVDELGEKFTEFQCVMPGLVKWGLLNGYNPTNFQDSASIDTIYKESPYYGSCAPDLNWEERVKMQSTIQRYITHSISSTVNLHSGVTPDTVSNIYIRGWELGLKGITVYRDGSRSGILVNDSEPTRTDNTSPLSRPEFLEAKVIEFMNGVEEWIAVVGVLANKPYEIFTGRREDLPNDLNGPETRYRVYKVREEGEETRYDLHIQRNPTVRVEVFKGLNDIFNEEYWNYAKLISGILRHGMPIEYVIHLIEHMKLDDTVIHTWKNGVVRALKDFVPDNTEAVDKKCPACGDKDGLVYKEGCLSCKVCGHSKC